MSYNSYQYFAIFLPVALILYQLAPRKYRWITLLCANYVFFFCFSKILVLYQIAQTLVTYVFGLVLGKMEKAPENIDKKDFRRRKQWVLAGGIVCVLSFLVCLKYLDSIYEVTASLFHFSYTAMAVIMPIGLSYYTLQNISYLADIAHKKIKANPNVFKLALYSSFFGTIVEGPITRYSDIAESLYAGESITADSFMIGAQRITWGLFQKIVIADHMDAVVKSIFTYHYTSGALAVLGAVLCTIQLYMDFAGTIDIVIGSAEIIHVKVAENFRQPFFAKNASDFWRRWHITLGTFLRDYIFYPISLSKPVQRMTKRFKAHHHKKLARYSGPAIALFFVWLTNGIWHGASAVYVLYGMYYFVFMIIEMFWEKPFENWCETHHLSIHGWQVKTFRFLKLSLIVVLGEMLFRAGTTSVAAAMFKAIATNFHISDLSCFWNLGMNTMNWITVIVCFSLVILRDVLKEKNYPMREKYENLPKTVKWGLYYGLVLVIIFFGAYGPAYSAVGMMYAGF